MRIFLEAGVTIDGAVAEITLSLHPAVENDCTGPAGGKG